MTDAERDAERDAAWRSLPAKIKEQFATDYANALQTHSFDPNNPRIDAHIKFLEECFGKHNLTASEEEKPLRSLTNGDKVIILSEPFEGIYGEVTDFIFDNGKLFIQVVSKIGEKLIEPQNLEIIPSTTQNYEKYAEKGVSGNADDEKTDWLVYRMELAKEVAVTYAKNCFEPKGIIDNTMAVVDGIVERLKGGEK